MKMKALTQTQEKVLKLGHDKGNFTAQDLPINGGARKMVIDSLLNRKLIKPINRNGRWFDYALTPAGRQAVGVEAFALPEKTGKAKNETRSG
ncbi:hypothetical protein M3P05_20045, partial [Sansalvadorimonas sp. 2012CJ34-2]